MTNGIEVGNYVMFHDSDIGRVIAIEDHENHFADLQVIFFDQQSKEICQLKVRADIVKKMPFAPQELAAKLDRFPGHIYEDPDFKEEFPGQQREMIVQDTIRRIVEDADRDILALSDGSNEDTDYITFRVAEAFIAKLGQRIVTNYYSKQLLPTYGEGKEKQLSSSVKSLILD